MRTQTNFRPMLASDAQWDHYQQIFEANPEGYLLASTKLDGIRATVRGGILVSRTLKPIRNDHIQSILGHEKYEGMDGELIVGLGFGEGVFARTSSGVMSQAGIPDFTYYVFDDWQLGNEGLAYQERLKILQDVLIDRRIKGVELLPQVPVRSLQELAKLEESAIKLGYEGLIVRSPDSPYKFGRSTLKERYMLKLKRFHDSEAQIIGFQELTHNLNEPTQDHLGLQVRSSHRDNKIAGDTLGALIVQDLHNPDWQFNIGTGFDSELRKYIWERQEEFHGKTVKYKYLSIGIKDLPRHPVFMGVRHESDM